MEVHSRWRDQQSRRPDAAQLRTEPSRGPKLQLQKNEELLSTSVFYLLHKTSTDNPTKYTLQYQLLLTVILDIVFDVIIYYYDIYYVLKVDNRNNNEIVYPAYASLPTVCSILLNFRSASILRLILIQFTLHGQFLTVHIQFFVHFSV